MFCTICRKNPPACSVLQESVAPGPLAPRPRQARARANARQTVDRGDEAARSPGPFLVKVVCEEAAQGKWTLHVVYGRDAQDDVPGLDPRAPVTDVCARCAVRQRRGARRVGRES